MAYEDRRTIGANGLLSARSSPRYTPQPIYTPFNNLAANKPPPGMINVNKAQEEQRAMQMHQQQQADAQFAKSQEPPPKKGGMSVLCDAAYQLGYMEAHIYEADQRYGHRLDDENPGLLLWYHKWAKPLAEIMLRKTWTGRLLGKILWLFIEPWSIEMASREGATKQGDKFGKLLLGLGLWLAK